MKEYLLHHYMFAAAQVTSISPKGLPGASSSNTTSSEIGTLISIADAAIGAVAVLMITISGLRYITSDGDPQKAAQARSGIIYSLVGIAVAISAQAIVTFTLGNT